MKFCKLNIIFYEMSKKQEKEAGTYFILLSQSRNIIERYMKTYLHSPINILQFLTPENTPTTS